MGEDNSLSKLGDGADAVEHQGDSGDASKESGLGAYIRIQQQNVSTEPWPTASDLEIFERVVLGSAREIVTQIVENLISERMINKETFAALREDSRSNRHLSFILGVLILAVGVTFLFKEQPGYGAMIICGTLVAVVGIFVTGRKQTDRDDST